MSIMSRLKQFRRSETGSMSVEAVIIFPLLLWGYAAMFIYWDAFKAQNLNLKATYTVADLVSREVLPITPTYIDGMNDIYGFLIRRNEGNDMRVTVVRFVESAAGPEAPPDMELRWSDGTGSYAPYTNLSAIQDDLPTLMIGDELIVVETQMWWSPPINFSLESVGLSRRQFSNMVFTSPRFTPQVQWDGDEDGVADDLTS